MSRSALQELHLHAAQDGKCTSGALRTGDWVLVVDPTFEKSAWTCSAEPDNFHRFSLYMVDGRNDFWVEIDECWWKQSLGIDWDFMSSEIVKYSSSGDPRQESCMFTAGVVFSNLQQSRKQKLCPCSLPNFDQSEAWASEAHQMVTVLIRSFYLYRWFCVAESFNAMGRGGLYLRLQGLESSTGSASCVLPCFLVRGLQGARVSILSALQIATVSRF